MLEELHNKLINNEITSDELVKKSLDESKCVQDTLNPFVTICENAKGNEVTDNILSGIPYVAKDNLSTKDVLSTASSNTLKDIINIIFSVFTKKEK